MKNILVVANDINYQKSISKRVRESYERLNILENERGVNVSRSSVYEYNSSKNSFSKWETFYQGKWFKITDIKPDIIRYKSNVVNYFTRIIEDNNKFINDTKFVELVNDKYLTSILYKEFSPVSHIISNIKTNKFLLNSFSTEQLILKPNWGSWWFSIKKIQKADLEKYINNNLYNDYLLQEFVDFSWGVDWIVEWIHDIRFMISWDKLRCPIIRTPKKWNICCNISQWWDVIYPKMNDLSNDILNIANKIKESIKKETERAISYINFNIQKTDVNIKTVLKERVDWAYDVAISIYNKNKTSKSIHEIKRLIIDALYDIRLGNSNSYYVIGDFQGNIELL